MMFREDIEIPGRGQCEKMPMIYNGEKVWVVNDIATPPCQTKLFEPRYIVIDCEDNGRILDRKYCYK